MFHQDHGGKFASGNKRFEVGGEVFANLNSNYTGLFGYHEDERCRRAAEKAKESPFPEGTPDRLTWAYNRVLSEDIEDLISQNCSCLHDLSRAEYEVMLAEEIEAYRRMTKCS